MSISNLTQSSMGLDYSLYKARLLLLLLSDQLFEIMMDNSDLKRLESSFILSEQIVKMLDGI